MPAGVALRAHAMQLILDAEFALALQRPDVAMIPPADPGVSMKTFAITKRSQHDELSVAAARFLELADTTP